MRKISVLIGLISCISAGALLTLSGCGGAGESKSGKPTIAVWHWMTDRDAVFGELAKKYEAQTGVKISFELYAPDVYSQKIRAAAQGQNLPAIFGVLGEKRDFASFIKAGYILDLTPFMDENNAEWRNSFYAKAMAVNEFAAGNIYDIAPGVYGVPIDIMNIQMVYNKALLDKVGVKNPPATFQEFLDIGKKLKAANIQGLVSGWGEIWMIDCLANGYAFNIMGKDKVLATIRGEVPYTDPDWVKVFSLFKDMQDSGVLANGIVTMVNKTAEQLFANERAAFAFNGSWCVNVYKGMNPSLDYGVMLPPKVSDRFPMSIWGGAGSSFMVNPKLSVKDEAVKFLKWLTEKDQQAYLSQATNNLPANKHSVSKLSPVLAQFSRDMDLATHPSVWGVSEFSAVIETIDKEIQSIIIGEKTPAQVAADVQKVKEREMAKRSKQ